MYGFEQQDERSEVDRSLSHKAEKFSDAFLKLFFTAILLLSTLIALLCDSSNISGTTSNKELHRSYKNPAPFTENRIFSKVQIVRKIKRLGQDHCEYLH